MRHEINIKNIFDIQNLIHDKIKNNDEKNNIRELIIIIDDIVYF